MILRGLVYTSLCIAYISTYAQESPKEKFYFMDVNGAVGSAWMADLAFNAEIGDFLYTIETQNFSNGGCWLCDIPPTTLKSYNVLIGKVFKGQITYSAVSIGLGFGQYAEPYESGTYQGLFFTHTNYKMERQNIVALPIEFKAGISAKVISLQMKTGLNINNADSMFYIGLGLGFGKFF